MLRHKIGANMWFFIHFFGFFFFCSCTGGNGSLYSLGESTLNVLIPVPAAAAAPAGIHIHTQRDVRTHNRPHTRKIIIIPWRVRPGTIVRCRWWRSSCWFGGGRDVVTVIVVVERRRSGARRVPVRKTFLAALTPRSNRDRRACATAAAAVIRNHVEPRYNRYRKIGNYHILSASSSVRLRSEPVHGSAN